MEQDRVVSFTTLARFGKAVWRHLWLIALVVALAGAIALYWQTLTPQPYEAESWLLVKTAPASPDQVAAYGGDLDSMAALLASVALESRVLANPASASLPADVRRPGALLPAIDIKADTRPDYTGHVFRVVATQPTPADAVMLANLWADESVAFLNQYYLADVGGLQKLQAQAQANYDQAQHALEAYLSTTSIPALQAQAAALDSSLGAYYDAQGGNEAGVYVEQLRANQRNLGDQYALLGKLQLAIGNAQALRSAISSSPSPRLADSVALASLLTTASSLVPTGTLPVQIQLTDPAPAAAPPSQAQQLQDLDDLLAVLQTRIASVQAGIDRTSQDILATRTYSATGTVPPQLEVLAQRDRDLNKQLESAQATKKELEGKRDLYWDSYTDVSKRLLDVTQGLSRFNEADEIVRADERLVTRPTATNRAILSTLAVSLAAMILIVLLYEFVAPGRQLGRELLHWRPGRRPAASTQ